MVFTLSESIYVLYMITLDLSIFTVKMFEMSTADVVYVFQNGKLTKRCKYLSVLSLSPLYTSRHRYQYQNGIYTFYRIGFNGKHNCREKC